MSSLPSSTVVIWDTEFTSWAGAHERRWSGEGEWRELVQIAAHHIDLDRGEVLAELDILVKPERNPQLSDYFMNLTHLAQADVDAQGLSFPKAYQVFKDFTQNLPCVSYGMDQVVVQENCALHDMAFDMNNVFLDATAYLRCAGVPVTEYTSGTVSKAFGIELDGHVHNAMHDVRSLSAAILELHRLGRFKI